MAPSNYSSASSSDFSNYSSSSAPLPSPSSSQPAQYFPSQPNLHRHRTSISVPQSQAPTSQPQSQSQEQLQQSQQQATQQYGHEPYGGANQTGFCLIAEAAKRAQMEVTMRDMGDLSL
ncbi:hypothetical protein N7G274_009111 [Stereocaulon virgatum]|uniref:Uncharacterized protein n=1 Tax=Stereocaulon virgatum TaxID=373712 RepID=A0ABR3ZZG1_9LECA